MLVSAPTVASYLATDLTYVTLQYVASYVLSIRIMLARPAEAIFDRSGRNQICHHCLCGASTHIVCKAHVHAKHANSRGVWGHAPPENF